MPLPEARNPEEPEPAQPRRPWLPPELIKHDSLSALTQQQQRRYPPYPAYPDSLDPYALADIPCSQGFCP